MAAMTTSQKTQIRQAASRKATQLGVPVDWVKDAINDAAQAIINTLDGDVPLQQSEIGPTGTGFNVVMSNRIDNATSPYGFTFNVTQKKWLFAFVCEIVFQRDS